LNKPHADINKCGRFVTDCQALTRLEKIMTWHVIPNNDWIEHEETTTCPCEPRVEIINGEMIIIHNALDQRELKEIKLENKKDKK